MNDSSLLWKKWEKTLCSSPRRTVLIEAATGKAWTAKALTDEAEKLAHTLPSWKKGGTVAFRLPNGASWMALFLALQKRGLAALPLDGGLPDTACRELAQRLGCHALYLNGSLEVLDENAKPKKEICCVKVTSGVGGLPKQVFCRAEHLAADGANIIRTMGIRRDDRNLAAIPLGHSYGLGNFVMPLILQGTPVVCAGPFLPQQLTEWIRRHRVTVFPSVPAIFRVLSALPGRSRLTPLRLAISAGAPLTAEVAQAFFTRYRIKLHNFYGSSETGGISYDRAGEATLNGRSVGKPLTGVRVTIARHAIRVASAAVAKPGNRWRVPDRGAWNAQGELVLQGRHGREVNIGGKKVHPAEVEHALRAIPGVSDALVWENREADRPLLHAAVETRLSLAEIQRALAAKLPEWKWPKRYDLRAEFPRSARGKVDLAALRR